MASTYGQFRSEPQPLYHGPQSMAATRVVGRGNLMNDRRVVRGSTYSASLDKDPLQDYSTTQKKSRGRLKTRSSRDVQERVQTPEPIPGRKHEVVQTVDFLEDLRVQQNFESTLCQTDYEMDLPVEPLFTPLPSGPSVATQIQEDELFDFHMEVEPILAVLVDKALDQALMEVLQEQEEQEIEDHKQAYMAERTSLLASMQRMENKEKRLAEEAESRLQQAVVASQSRDDNAARVAAQTVAKETVSRIGDQFLDDLENKGFFFDPVRREVQEIFFPWLHQELSAKLTAVREGRASVDQAVRTAGLALRKRAVTAQYDLLQRSLNSKDGVESIWLAAQQWGRDVEKQRREASFGPDFTPELKEERRRQMLNEIANTIRTEDDVIRIQALHRARDAKAKAGMLKSRAIRRGEFGKPVCYASKILRDLPVGFGGTLAFDEKTKTVVVHQLGQFSGACYAGLVEGDAILAIDGTAMTSTKFVQSYLDGSYAGDEVTVMVRRALDGREEEVVLELTANTNQYTQQEIRELRRRANFAVSSIPLLTADEAHDLLDDAPATLNFECGEVDGQLVVGRVHQDGSAARAGLKKGDILISLVDDEPVMSGAQVEKTIERCDVGALVPMTVIRDAQGEENELELTLEVYTPDKTVEQTRSLRRIAGLELNGDNGSPAGPSDEPLSQGEKNSHVLHNIRPALGFQARDADGGGVLVTNIERSGAAVHAGLVEGDVVLSLEQTKDLTVKQLLSSMKHKMPGDCVKLSVRRAYDGRTQKVVLEFFSDEDSFTQGGIRALRQGLELPAAISGLYDPSAAREEVRDLKYELGATLEPNQQGSGLVVSAVQEGSTAARAGLVVGSVIKAMKGIPVDTLEQVDQVLSKRVVGDMIDIDINDSKQQVTMELAANVEAEGGKYTVEWVRCLRLLARQPDSNDEVDAQLAAYGTSLGFEFDYGHDAKHKMTYLRVTDAKQITGLSEGDRVIRVAGQKAPHDAEELEDIMTNLLPGDEIRVQVARGHHYDQARVLSLEIQPSSSSKQTIEQVRTIRSDAGYPVL